jgi:hypothetical protein
MHFRILAASLILTAPLRYSFGLNTSTAFSMQLPPHTKPSSATTRVETAVQDYALWIDGKKWKLNKVDTLGELKLSHVSGDVTAKIETDRLATPTAMLREILLEGIKRADPNAQIISEEQRMVNGREILAIQFVLNVEGHRSRVFGYYHGGSSGCLQVIAYTLNSKFANNISEITEFLDGLDVRDQDLPSSANHILYPGMLWLSSTINLSYDPTKWRQVTTSDPRYFDFLHIAGHGHGLAEVGVVRLTVPNEFVPVWVLASYKASYPKAKLLTAEKRTVNGTEVWFVKMETGRRRETTGDHEILWGYYYCDKGGTIEAEIFGDKAFFNEYEKDLMAFLNGLGISEMGDRITRSTSVEVGGEEETVPAAAQAVPQAATQ